MKAILTVKQKTSNHNGEQTVEERLLFDTEKSRKICDVVNEFGHAVKELYISTGGIIFCKYTETGEMYVEDQETAKDYIGRHQPETYMAFFGKIKEA